MLVKEIVEKTFSVSIKTIGDEIGIGEKRLREALKDLGCKPSGVGKKGWIFDGEDESILEKSIFDFVQPSKRKSKNNDVDASIENSESVNDADSENNSIKNDADNNIDKSKVTSRKENDMVADIKALIKGKSKDENARVYKGIYFDKDIAEFLDNVQHGNKSEIVNKILRQYLIENELM